MSKNKTDKNGRTAKEVAEEMVVDGYVKVGLVRLSGSELYEVEKITDSGRIYIEDHYEITYFTPRLGINDEWYWINGSFSAKKPDGYVEDSMGRRTEVELEGVEY